MSHTAGPWVVSPDNPSSVWASVGGRVAEAVASPRNDSEANARRIAACVNACEGIPTGVLVKAAGVTEAARPAALAGAAGHYALKADN